MAELVRRSTGHYPETMYVNLHETHYSYIRDINMYCHSWRCHNCEQALWKTPYDLHRHERTCTEGIKRADIVGTLPKTLQMKGRQLLSAVTWNERGELIHKGVAIRGSNAVDLVHDLLRNRKTPDPVGWQQFANQMRAANIPMELVGNVTRRLYLQKKRGKRTPQKRTPETEWETL